MIFWWTYKELTWENYDSWMENQKLKLKCYSAVLFIHGLLFSFSSSSSAPRVFIFFLSHFCNEEQKKKRKFMLKKTLEIHIFRSWAWIVESFSLTWLWERALQSKVNFDASLANFEIAQIVDFWRFKLQFHIFQVRLMSSTF